ncbi:hypothetical protein [Cupriavidus sp. D39]|uniref:hypothetical protein n=1 Tax=Cupriavidus sp. D39 TaxID=2997877 RepID=UPI00227156BD|nr:hypothetical protein [Cupriavidus sp. D39]MCY0855741.1 hypothetical protein [Cupriavidus sp. D39]
MHLKPTYHPRTTHSLVYYQRVLLALIDGINRDLSQQQIADLLNESALPSPRGRAWTVVAVRKSLFKLRHAGTEPSKLHAALMHLFFCGTITRDQANVLITPSRVL